MQTELQLPYEPITEVANREYLRTNFVRSNREVYKIPVGDIKVRDGFNDRKIYERIEELAGLIYPKTKDGIAGLIEPLVVDVRPNGVIEIEKGHRRMMAIKLLMERGVWIEFVECYVNPKNRTEQERKEDVYNSNMGGEKLKPVEQASVVFALKNHFGKTSSEEIGKRLGISRQQVDNLLLIAECDDSTKRQMLEGNLGITEALKYIRSIKKASKQTDKVEEDSHKNTAGKTPFPKDELADEVAELKELDRQAEEIKDDDETAEEKVRIVNAIIKEFESTPLELVGNKIANNRKEKSDDEKPKFDEGREEIVWCQNLIKNLDWLSVQSEKLPEQTAKDFIQRCNWLMKDAELIREWVSKNKKQNKVR